MSDQQQTVIINEATGTTPERPSWLPEKFNSPEDLAKSYAELEKKFSTPSTPPVNVNPNAPLEVPKPPVVDPNAPLDFSSFQEEYQTNGQLSDQSYQALAQKGLTKDFVDNYIDGQIAKQQSFTQAAYDIAGGQEQYAQALQWAGMNLSQSEIDAFNQSIRGTQASMKIAVAGLVSLYKASNNQTPNLLQGTATPAANTSGKFASQAELVKAMQDPRYAEDAAYRQSVYDRM